MRSAFGWTDPNLYRFTIRERNCGFVCDDAESRELKVDRTAGMRLRTLFSRSVRRFPYVTSAGHKNTRFPCPARMMSLGGHATGCLRQTRVGPRFHLT